MGYMLKEEFEVFQAMNDPFAYHTFTHGVEYEAVPKEEKYKFEKVPKKAVKAQTTKEKDEGGEAK